MKKIVLLAFLVCSFTATFAKIIRIKVVDNQFLNATVNAKVGDTILWVWQQGIHTSTSVSVPLGVTAWNKPLDSAHKQYGFILRVAGQYKYKCRYHAVLGMTGTINATAALSAGFSDLSVVDDNSRALVNWKTKSSKDVAYFSVQKSTDGNHFTEVSRISANSSNQYKFSDNNVTSAKYVYYQVEIVDNKGNHELSEIKMFTQKGAVSKLITSLSPNPISNPGHLMLQFNADKEGTLVLQLYSQSGTFVKQTELAAAKGLNNGHFHLGDLTPGQYYIVATLGGTKEKHSIVVK
jgi:plastocyanin